MNKSTVRIYGDRIAKVTKGKVSTIAFRTDGVVVLMSDDVLVGLSPALIDVIPLPGGTEELMAEGFDEIVMKLIKATKEDKWFNIPLDNLYVKDDCFKGFSRKYLNGLCSAAWCTVHTDNMNTDGKSVKVPSGLEQVV